MKKIFCLLVFSLALFLLSDVKRVAAVCTDADGDGTCAEVDCDDNNASLNRRDYDGDGVTSCDGDCADSDASVQYCEVEQTREEPNYSYPEYTCTTKYCEETRYNCPSGQVPAGGQCVVVWKYNWSLESCSWNQGECR